MQAYEDLLKKAMEKVPKNAGAGERFEIPEADVFPDGPRTIFRNFSEVSEKLRREPKDLLKFLTKELASPASFDGSRAVFQSRLNKKVIQQKIELFVKNFVFCRECRRPDTRLEKSGKIVFMKCEACGARSSVKPG